VTYNFEQELARLKSAWKDRLDDLHVLFSLAQEIGFARNVDLLLDQLVTRTAQILQAEAASLFLMNPDTGALDFGVVKGQKSEVLRNLSIHLRPGEGFAGWAAAHGKYVVSNKPREDSRFKQEVDWLIGFQTNNLVAIPLMARGKTLGVIEVINRLGAKDFTEQDIKLVESISWLATMALENAQAYQSTEAAQHYLANILESLPGGFISINKRYRVTHCNSRALDILGLTRDVIGQRYTVALSSQPAMIQALESAMSDNQGATRQSLTASTPKGRRQLGYSTLLIRDNQGNVEGFGIQFQDITDFA
jgi:PAS domain S-box-containing protein